MDVCKLMTMTFLSLDRMGALFTVAKSCQDIEHPWHSRYTLCLEHRELGENMTDEELQEMIDEAGMHVCAPRCLPRGSASS